MKNRRDVLREAILAAGEKVRHSTPSQSVIEKEGRANIVTAADLASEKTIMDFITSHFPDDSILSEETTSDISDPLSVEHLWVIDPIDGTNNFRYQRNYSAISIGYIEKGITMLGAAYDPFREELFYAERGKGAFVNDEPISISSTHEVAKASVATDNSYDPDGTKYNMELALKLPVTPWMIMKGSAVLTMCEVAAGRIDLYYHTRLKPWDNAAAFLLIEEAGGVVKGMKGEPITFMSPEVVVGNSKLVEQFIQGIRK